MAIPEDDLRFGDLVVAQGICTRERVDECLAELHRLAEAGTAPLPRLGELLARRGYLAASGGAPALGRYADLTKIGEGGMGEVWKAYDPQLRRWVAVKFLKGGDSEEILRFRREAQTCAKLSHPNIAAIFDDGESAGRHYIAMQFVEGRTMRALPRHDRRMLVRMVRDAARAVAFAHDQGIVHRDLKPDNLMVTERGHVFVMDFGLARAVEARSGVTRSGVMVGTPAYMSPEQAA